MRSINDNLPAQYIPKPESHHSKFCGGGLALDAKSSDSSLPHWLIRDALKEIFSHFDMTHYVGRGRVRGKSDLSRVSTYITEYLTRTPFLLGKIQYKYHGIPSGTMFTNVLNTVCLTSLVAWSQEILNLDFSYCVYGDNIHTDYRLSRSNCCRMVSLLHNEVGVELKCDPPGLTPCVAYCKTNCHMGYGYWTGLRLSNILSRCDKQYIVDVAHCLCSRVYPLLNEQKKQLMAFVRGFKFKPLPLPERAKLLGMAWQ